MDQANHDPRASSSPLRNTSSLNMNGVNISEIDDGHHEPGAAVFRFQRIARVSALVSGIMNGGQLMNSSRKGDGVINSDHHSRDSNVKEATLR